MAPVEVIDGDVEEALNLSRVQVAGHQAVGAHALHEVGHHFGPDAHPGLVLAVLAGVAVIGHHHGHGGGRGALGGIHHQHELHQVFGGRVGALNQEHGAAPHALVEAGSQLGIGEALNAQVA